MKGHHNDFFNMIWDGCVDGVPVKGLPSNTKAYGIGSFIIFLKDESRVFQQKCLEDVLYLPTLYDHYLRIFGVISAYLQDEFQFYFQSKREFRIALTFKVSFDLEKYNSR